ncbi:L,D-transpeptidase family protein [Bartonella bilalgolemii]|uniref:L,D-transpeptidase family protein n=1 Tax=Bartonella bilalgolemii TaxID=2942911 RepID=A0ABT0P7M2_9HYPH|nr:L,D-transpeptidase family protein [Bartonella sp. G70]MCL6229107.1 L,D-transpeptidase family protein [Bartonella sp. G70]
MQVALKKKIYIKQTSVSSIVIRRQTGMQTRGIFCIGQHRFFCALGRAGISAFKREGDGATPLANMRCLGGFRNNFYRYFPRSNLAIRHIQAHDGWCDASGDANYNRLVRLPYPKSAEKMQREDGLYDMGLILDWNIRERKMAKGSAIFIHLARNNYMPTEGCIALSYRDMQRILPYINQQTKIIILG